MQRNLGMVPNLYATLAHSPALFNVHNAYNAGLDDELVLEVLGQVVVNTMTNYGNHLAGTEIDFPIVALTL
ncbi:hypothetical protein [Aeromonas veronii]|uniref:hypothetical protein n=1 Tax=Aeromonas veronii TaxID=654 RepID=UPI003D1BE5A0